MWTLRWKNPDGDQWHTLAGSSEDLRRQLPERVWPLIHGGASSPHLMLSCSGWDALEQGWFRQIAPGKEEREWQDGKLNWKKGDTAVCVRERGKAPEWRWGKDVPPNHAWRTLEGLERGHFVVVKRGPFHEEEALELELLDWSHQQHITPHIQARIGVGSCALSWMEESVQPGAKVTYRATFAPLSSPLPLPDSTLSEEHANLPLHEHVVDDGSLDPLMDALLLSLRPSQWGYFSISNCTGSPWALKQVDHSSPACVWVHLVSCENRCEVWEEEDPLEEAKKLRQEGNVLYSSAKYDRALRRYMRGVDMLAEYEDRPAAHDLSIVCLSNGAQCHIQQQQWSEGLELCDIILERDPKHEKALFRSVVCLRHLGQVPRAQQRVETLMRLCPQNHMAKREKQVLDSM